MGAATGNITVVSKGHIRDGKMSALKFVLRLARILVCFFSLNFRLPISSKTTMRVTAGCASYTTSLQRAKRGVKQELGPISET